MTRRAPACPTRGEGFFGGGSLTRHMAQARHAVPAVVGDPGIEEAFGYTRHSSCIRARPTLDKDALDDLAALRGS